jgi:quercetin dioxygenase-like cupin family protein
VTFVTRQKIVRDPQSWGATDWLVSPELVKSRQLVVAEITIDAGQRHAFHLHVEQEEVIVVLHGTLTQWVGKSCRELIPGEAVHIPAGVVHASVNSTSEPVRALVALGPCVGNATGYHQVDMSEEEPWLSLGQTS